MKVNQELKRLKAIKLKKSIFERECSCCKGKFKKEKMWRVYRYCKNKRYNPWFYCQNCMHSAEEVLNEIDTDESIFGIAGVDNFWFFKKKDMTRINLARKKAFGRA